VGRAREILEKEGGTREQGVTHLPPGEGRTLRVMGEMVTYKVTGDQTGGACSLFEVSSPSGGGPPPHVQHRGDESIYVLEGELEFLLEDRVWRIGAGSLVFVPRGCLHAHKNVGDGPARMLVGHTPGRAHERFFDEIGRPVKDRLSPPSAETSPSMEEVVAIAAGYGIEIPPSEKRTQTQGALSERSERAARRSAYADVDAASKGARQ
jgi:quercetin dioxygenase-like cupin family protein